MSIRAGGQPNSKRIWPAGVEAWAPVAAVVLSAAVAAVLLLPRGFGLASVSPFSFFVSVFLGPLIVLAGTWIDIRGKQAVGLMFAGLGVLLAFNGAIATYFLGLLPF